LTLVSDQLRLGVRGRSAVLGTVGYGRSDGGAALRDHFEVDSKSVVVAALKALADDGGVDSKTVAVAISELGVKPDKPNPVTQ
jgi:pyruvate dehydrogenase E1 component